MEDPEAEWKIQQYYSSSSNSKEDDQPSVVRRILSNGYAIGKEFVITGIFISSAPLVVPSLVVVSAVGFVFTVPFGVLLTSYVCTNKIMSMLFPTPVPSPLRLEYYYSDGDGDEDYERMDCKLGLGLGLDDDVVEKYEGDYGGEVEGYVTDGEDNDVVEDVNEEVEKEIGFGFEFADDNRQLDDYGAEVEGYVADKEDKEIVEDVNEEVEVEIVFEFDDDSRREGETSTANADEDVEEMEMEDDILQREINDTKDKERVQMEDAVQGVEMESSFDVVGDGDQGYEEDAGEYLEGDDDSLEEELKGEKLLVDDRQLEVNEDSKVMEVGRVDHVNNTIEDGCVVSEGASNVVLGDVETNKSVTSVNASDVIFGDIKDVETTKQVTSESSSNAVFGDDDDVGTTEPVTVIEIESEKLIEKGNKNDEPIGEMRHVVILSDGNDANNFNSRVVDELDLVAREVMGDANKDERTIESAEEVLRKSMGTQGNNGSDAYKDGSEDAFMLSMEEHLVHSNADALEINQEDLLDERNTNNNFKVGNEVKENVVDDVDVASKRNMDNGNEVKKNVVDDNVKHNTDNGNEVKENTTDDIGNEVKKDADDDNVDVVARAPSKHDTDTDNANVVYKKMSSREENLDDEKIWEKIAAMRTIVGYKAPTQPTCIGELKALYVFTGVEPPASFDADSDLDAKLKFLMAIVGVK